ncbi:MAG: GNAT family N-acetyltransferase [Geminicoccaceae bacterium]
MQSRDYSFTFAASADMPMLAGWLRQPEVALWWGDPAEQEALLAADLDDPNMLMRIVSYKGHPFAYVQDYDVHNWPQPFLAHLPAGSRGIDTFIGDVAMIGMGHGPPYLRLLAEELLADGAPLLVTDPDPANGRARRAYKKAGFSGDRQVETEEGPAILMTFTG